MKHSKLVASISALCLLMIIFSASYAVAVEGRASEVFESAYVVMGSDYFTEFGVSAQYNCPSIYVSSCALQEMDSKGKVIATTKLTPPSDKAKNTSNFTAWKTYSGTKGKRYRIKAVFYADGETMTCYSTIVTGT